MSTSNNVWEWSSTPGSNSTADAGINWAEGQAPSTVNDSARGMMAAVANFRKDYGGVTTTGSANAYSVTTNSGFTALATGLRFSAKINATNTSTSTINVDGLGAKSIRKFTSSGESALAGSELLINGRYDFIYDTAANSAAGGWICLNPTPANATSALSNTSRLYGSSSSSTTLQEITLGTGLSMSSTTLNTSAVTTVTAGTGLTGGGSGGSVTVNVSLPITAYAYIGSSGTNLKVAGCTVSRTGTGIYAVSFNSTAADANYIVTFGVANNYLIYYNNKTTSGFDVRIRNVSLTNTDEAWSMMVMGT